MANSSGGDGGGSDGGGTASNPWFNSQTPSSANATTSMGRITNTQIAQIAIGLGTQNTSLITAINALTTAINNKPTQA